MTKRTGLAAAILLLAGAAALVVWIALPSPTPARPDTGDIARPQERPAGSTLPRIPFVDVAASAGVAHRHESGAAGEKLLPETMGGGCAIFDFDLDGDGDLLFVNGAPWPHDRDPSAPLPASIALFRNDTGSDGELRFTNVTEAAGLAAPGLRGLYAMGVAVGDVDGDGDGDVYVTAVGANRLLRNDGGRFVDVTDAWNAAGPADAWSTSAGFLDVENDGDLDLFVCNYVEWSRSLDLAAAFTMTGIGRAYGPPKEFAGAHSVLLRNDGGRFTDVSAASGIQVENPATGTPVGKALGLAFIDVETDGDLDVIVANDTTRNLVFRNDGDGRFTEIGIDAGVAFDAMGGATGAMGIDAAHVRDDGSVTIGIGNFANETSSLYANLPGDPWFFEDTAIIDGVGAPSRRALTFGVLFLDLDLDGRLDMLQANGHIESEIAVVQPGQAYAQPAQLFWNAGDEAPAIFTVLEPERIGALAAPIVGRGATAGDLDRDGDLDVVLTQIDGPPLVLRNDVIASGATPADDAPRWLRLHLRGTRSNPDAIGARIEVELASGRTLVRTVRRTCSYLSQADLPVTVGIPPGTQVADVTVRWPSGRVQPLGPVLPGATTIVTEAE